MRHVAHPDGIRAESKSFKGFKISFHCKDLKICETSAQISEKSVILVYKNSFF